MRYGLPYKGSKNGIAEWIVRTLPAADTFVDLFCGGGAVTHAAMLSGKWEHFIMNDIDARLPELFKDCAFGKHTIKNHPEWISRQEFHERKADDAYIALVWSFGNNGIDYLYGEDIEEFKHAYHKAVFYGELEGLQPYGYKLTKSNKPDVYERYLDYQRQIKIIIQDKPADITRLNNLERIQNIESLQRLQSLQSLQSFGRDFAEVLIPKGALIYCDIPYNNSKCGKYKGFNHERFYEWARQQDNIFISEYHMPDDFIPFARIEKAVMSAANTNAIKATETIFTNRQTYESFDSTTRDLIKTRFGNQVSIFDFISEEAP